MTDAATGNGRGELPPGWVWTTLGDVLQVIRGVSYKKEDARNAPASDLIAILRATNIEQGLTFNDLVFVPSRYVSDDQILRVGDIVIAASSGSRSVVGKAAPLISAWDGSFGAFCYGLRPNQEVSARYIAAFLTTAEYRNRVSQLSAGVNINNLKREHIEQTPLPLPPLAEQHRIVAAIEEQLTRLDAAVAALVRTRANLKRYRAAVLAAACSGRLVPTEADLARADGRPSDYEPASALLDRILSERRARWESAADGKGKGKRHAYQEPAPPDTSGLPELPEGWCWASLETCTVRIGDVDHKMPKAVESGIPYISTKDFTPDDINFDGSKRITSDDFEALARKIKPDYGDILISRYGTVGEVRQVQYREPFQASYSVAIVKTLGTTDLNDYLVVALRSRQLQDEMRGYIRASSQPDLGLEYIRKLRIPLPPLAEQQRIVAEVERRLSVVEELERSLAHGLARAGRLRQAVLRKAFAGELVAQDAGDEPAGVLLERVRGERKGERGKGKAGGAGRRGRANPL